MKLLLDESCWTYQKKRNKRKRHHTRQDYKEEAKEELKNIIIKKYNNKKIERISETRPKILAP